MLGNFTNNCQFAFNLSHSRLNVIDLSEAIIVASSDKRESDNTRSIVKTNYQSFLTIHEAK